MKTVYMRLLCHNTSEVCTATLNLLFFETSEVGIVGITVQILMQIICMQLPMKKAIVHYIKNNIIWGVSKNLYFARLHNVVNISRPWLRIGAALISVPGGRSLIYFHLAFPFTVIQPK